MDRNRSGQVISDLGMEKCFRTISVLFDFYRVCCVGKFDFYGWARVRFSSREGLNSFIYRYFVM